MELVFVVCLSVRLSVCLSTRPSIPLLFLPCERKVTESLNFRIIMYKKRSCRREIARYFVSLNISLSHSRSLKVIDNGIIRKLGKVSYSHSVVTKALSAPNFRMVGPTSSKIAIFFIPRLHSTPPIKGPNQNIAITFSTHKLEWCGYPMVLWWKTFYDMFSLFDTISACDRQTGGQTDIL